MKVNYTILLQALLLERDRLLSRNPELIKYQLEFDSTVSDCPNGSIERLEKFNELLSRKLKNELIPATNKLRELQKRMDIIIEDAA